ncbi:hypothetical protein T440DRAFT_129754 [Plenodomus tracheiphilus IPT5]|uniref:Uncharacterized protein n=1 Tax=Plenodomus tracheiphilus IPT5 TaxID=1408161 RepID=A0A6A7B213_9PLEO|nr:hypothetical protein T440DRAFT_129754 [Plenodomus tracheiphilus IPT5]
MSLPWYDALAYYSTPPNSYIGTTIFLSYIVAALYATITITISLYGRYNTLPNTYATPKNPGLNAAKNARKRHVKIYAFLASISFATLSYNMLMFLITHYLSWSGDQNPSVTKVTVSRLKSWMLDSPLFQDFAQDLVKDAPSAVWTQSAIVATWFWNIWMAQKARQQKIDASTMRTYIILSQILPISLTASLFIIQLHLSAPEFREPKDAITLPETRRKPTASPQIPNILLNIALLALPALRDNSIFSPLVLFERLALLLPHSSLLSLRDAEIVKCITVSGGFLVANAVRMRKEITPGNVLTTLGDGGYAVKALSWDAVLGAVVCLTLGWGGGV